MKEFEPFRLDLVNQCLWKRNAGAQERILVKPKAFAILRYLVDHPGRLVTQGELLDAVWPKTYVQPEVLKRHMVDIRNLLGDHPKQPRFIETRPWRGYQFIASVGTVASPEPHGNVIAGTKLLSSAVWPDVDLRKEISRLIQQKRNVDRAIACFERLAAFSGITDPRSASGLG